MGLILLEERRNELSMDTHFSEHFATQLSSLFHTFVLIILNTTNHKKLFNFLIHIIL